jgi:type IV pilus assembly protein PilF
MKDRLAAGLFCFLTFLAFSGCVQDRAALQNRVQAKESLGLSLVGEGRLEAGLKELLEAEELSPESAEIKNGIGIAYRDLGSTDRAILYFERALKLNPNFAEAQNNLGTVYLMRKEWAPAIALFRKASENVLYPTPYMAYNNMGYAFFQMGEYDRALESYRKALERFPSYSPALGNQGLTYEAIQKWDEAIHSYENAIRHDPNAPLYSLLLGKLFLKLYMHKEASEELAKAVKKDSEGFYAEEAKRLLQKVNPGR